MERFLNCFALRQYAIVRILRPELRGSVKPVSDVCDVLLRVLNPHDQVGAVDDPAHFRTAHRLQVSTK